MVSITGVEKKDNTGKIKDYDISKRQMFILRLSVENKIQIMQDKIQSTTFLQVECLLFSLRFKNC